MYSKNTILNEKIAILLKTERQFDQAVKLFKIEDRFWFGNNWDGYVGKWKQKSVYLIYEIGNSLGGGFSLCPKRPRGHKVININQIKI